jgi:hypothetical protein
MPQRMLELLTSWGASFGYGPKGSLAVSFVVFNVVSLAGADCAAV